MVNALDMVIKERDCRKRFLNVEQSLKRSCNKQNDRLQGMLQCQAVSSDLGASMMGLTRSGEEPKKMLGTPGRKEQGCTFPAEKAPTC